MTALLIKGAPRITCSPPAAAGTNLIGAVVPIDLPEGKYDVMVSAPTVMERGQDPTVSSFELCLELCPWTLEHDGQQLRFAASSPRSSIVWFLVHEDKR